MKNERLDELIAMYEAELPALQAAKLSKNLARTLDTIDALKVLQEARIIHLASNGIPPDEKRYTRRDVEALVSICVAIGERHRQSLPRAATVPHSCNDCDALIPAGVNKCPDCGGGVLI